jgi:hypothetical protein
MFLKENLLFSDTLSKIEFPGRGRDPAQKENRPVQGNDLPGPSDQKRGSNDKKSG